MSDKPKLKAVVNEVMKLIEDNLKIGVPASSVDRTLSKWYNKGIDDMEIKFNTNFVANPDRFEEVKQFTLQNINGLNDYVKDEMRKAITIGLINLESVSQIAERIQKVSDMAVTRARTIARTEANRALNMAHKDAAQQSGLDLKKQWVAKIDDRTSPICLDLDGEIKDMDEKFEYKGQEWDIPPAHPNCRSRVIYIQQEVEA